ncbi:hypothetical protein [Labedaea rhizosphaerae]|uniref:Regulation of enolase protein 1 (Concanavalin A-like superfamily) n=1 Tax=Labedaea rhizosphaerae TaxID=598644 RepID=A0A4R6S5B9_LABRH|nr:hypothetical protein [Labedaea rhizosphaerae]TDP94910.1 hypothetical protein EV186_105142 [Labedaea rhizosphaerae]
MDFLRPARLVALAVAALSIIGLGLFFASNNHASCGGPCPPAPTASDGSLVADRFWFYHRDLGREGSITVRLTAMTGTITYPPPNHDKIVPGLVPWAKTGIIVKDGLRRGSRYAALMLTGGHGVRFQSDYTNDVAGSATGAPHWLRLTRSGAIITGAESADGKQWHTVGSATLDGLPATVQVGLFATSPGDLTLREVGLGGAIEEVRFTQAVGTFDHVTVVGARGAWASESVGEMNQTDWEKLHNPSGAVARDGVVTVSGTGDIGPVGEDGAFGVDKLLMGFVLALLVVVVLAARYGARTQPSIGRAGVVGAATFGTGLLGMGVVVPVGMTVLAGNGVLTQPLSFLTGARVIVGVALVFGLCAVFAYGLGAWLHRAWAAVLCGLTLVVVPYALATIPLLPDSLDRWLLRLTPAAGFGIGQTQTEYPQVTAHFAPSTGYFPLPWWAGLLVLCAYTAAALWLCGRRSTTPNWR